MAAEKKGTKKKAGARSATPKKKAAAAKENAVASAPPRGEPLIAAILAKLTGPESPSGEPQPLDITGLRAAEDAAGVALSPSLHAVLSHDAGWLAREYRWFDAEGRLLARPTIEVIGGHAGVFTEEYEDLCAARFPGKAIALDQGSDSMRLLYFGDPDELGEYPVLFIDHDDVPTLGVAAAGIDLWLARMLDVTLDANAARARAETSKRILGSTGAWNVDSGSVARLSAPKAGPPPGTVSFTRLAAPAVEERPKRLTDKQLARALSEHAEHGNQARLCELLADAKMRGLPQKALDNALVGAAKAGNEGALRLLLAAGASANARDHYGAALSRLIVYGRSPSLAQVLLDAGANPNALFEAVERGSIEMVRLLLERGADPQQCDSNGCTPLHIAARVEENPVMVEVLLGHGASTEAGTNHSRALHWAVERGNREVAQRLVARGADVNARSRYLGRTSLHIAFERGDDALAGDLVRAGADRTIADERGITLAEVYGPAGEDVRPIEVHYVPSAEEQQLTLALRLAVTNHHAMPGFYYPPLQAGFWASLIDNGLASGAAFDPAASRARVIASFDPRTIGSAGFHDVRQELAIAAVAPELFRLVARKLFARAMDGTVRDGLRVVALSIRGSQEGTSALDAATLRAWITDERVQLGQCAGDLPFSFRTEQGAPAIAVTPAGDLGDEASGHILAAGTAWLEMAELWPCLAAGPTPFYTLSPDTREERAARYTLFAPGAPRGARDAFPFAHGPAEAALRSAMRALHAKVPLREVVLTLPG